MTSVAVIGLGKMGVPMTERLLSEGHRVRAFNRSFAATEALARQGAVATLSAAEAASGAEFVLTVLPTEGSVLAVYEELATIARPEQLFVDLSTVGIGLSHRCDELITARGAAYLDAPVSGGPAGAKAGTLAVMAGGSLADFERARPVFEAFGKTIRLCGPVGTGQAVKLVNQLLVGIHTAAICEAAVLGVKLGADPAVVLEVIAASFGGSAMVSRNLPRIISREFDPATPIALILKDLGIILQEARRCGVPLLLGAVTEERFSEATRRGIGGEDMAALVKLWEQAASTVVTALGNADA